MQQIGFAFRQITKNPATSILAVAVLALAIGGNTAMFAVIDSVLLRPLPYQQSKEIVIVNNGTAQQLSVDSWLDYDDLNRRAKSYQALAAFTVDQPVVQMGQSSKLALAVRTTANLLDVLGIRPVMGRAFSSEDSRMGAAPVALLTSVFWHENLNSDPNVIGKQLTIGGTQYSVVGVLPPGLKFPEFWGSDAAHGVWLPLQVTPDMLTQRSNRFLIMVGRLRPGVRIAAAQREAAAITQALGRTVGSNQVNFTVVPLSTLVTGDVRPALIALMVAMGLVLLIACFDVANLQSARFLSRTLEFALRRALGASRSKLIGQVLAEVSAVCACGAGVGLFVAWTLLRLISLFPQDTLVRADEIHFRWDVIAALAGFSLLTALLSALVPAFQIARNDANLTAAEVARGASAGVSKRRVSRWLISGEVALSVVLLIGAALLLRTVIMLGSITAGADAKRVTMFWVVPSQSGNSSVKASSLTRNYNPMLEQIAHLPGVTGAAFTSAAPLNNAGMQAGFNIVGQSANYPPVFLRAVSPDYVRVLGTPVLRGRMISGSDTPNSQFIAVVNQAFVTRYFGNSDPLGKQLELAKSIGMIRPYTIVGVLANTVQNQVGQSPEPEVSIAYGQIPPDSPFYGTLIAPGATYIVRTAGQVDVRQSIRSLFNARGQEMALDAMQTLDEAQHNSTFRARLGFYLIAGFAAMALLLVVAGLYGVLSQLVGQRRREIGIRMALGADRSDILRLVGKEGMIMIAIGSAIGLSGSFACGRFIASFLYGVKPTDSPSYIAVILVLTLVGCAATIVPAYRASRVELADSLRMD